MTWDTLRKLIDKVQVTKEKVDNWTSSKLKTCVSKHIVKNIKRQPSEWEKIFANHMSDSVISRIYKDSYNKKTTQFKKWTKDFNRRLSKQDI